MRPTLLLWVSIINKHDSGESPVLPCAELQVLERLKCPDEKTEASPVPVQCSSRGDARIFIELRTVGRLLGNIITDGVFPPLHAEMGRSDIMKPLTLMICLSGTTSDRDRPARCSDKRVFSIADLGIAVTQRK